jgi:hypothetical protein
MARQVLQVKRKNSTNCSPPEARLTVSGSVAWSSGPREVAMGKASTGGVAVRTTEGVEFSTDAGLGVTLRAPGAAAEGASVETPSVGAQAAKKKAIRHRIGTTRFLIIFL